MLCFILCAMQVAHESWVCLKSHSELSLVPFSRVIGESTTGPTRTHCMWSSPSLSLSSSFLFRASSSMLSLALVQVSVGISLLHCILTNHTSKYLSLLDLTFLTYTPLLIYWLCKGFLKKITLTLQPRRIQSTFPPCCSSRPRSASSTSSSSSPPSSLSASVSPSRQSLNNAKNQVGLYWGWEINHICTD